MDANCRTLRIYGLGNAAFVFKCQVMMLEKYDNARTANSVMEILVINFMLDEEESMYGLIGEHFIIMMLFLEQTSK